MYSFYSHDPDQLGIVFEWSKFFLTKDEEIEPYRRFWPKTRRFPITIAFPNGLTTTLEHHRGEMMLFIGDAVHVNLAYFDSMARYSPNTDWAMAARDPIGFWQRYFPSSRPVKKYKMLTRGRDLVRVGSDGMSAPAVVWEGRDEPGGEIVFFHTPNRDGMISIGWHANKLSPATYRKILTTFAFLDSGYFSYVENVLGKSVAS